MSRFFSHKFDALTPYVPGEQPGDMQRLVKLNTNENPFPPAPKALLYAREHTRSPEKYSDPEGVELRRALGFLCGVRPEEIVGPKRPGRSVAYTGDTVPLDSIAEACSGADVLIHESTYSKDEKELAVKNLHSTCVEAAETAKKAGVRALILTHISNRYSDTDELLAQSKEVFPDTYVAEDMDFFEISASSVRQA